MEIQGGTTEQLGDGGAQVTTPGQVAFRTVGRIAARRDPLPVAAVAAHADVPAGASLRPRGSGLENHLLAVVLLVLEELVAARRLGQRQSMSDHAGRVELSPLDALEQWPHVPLHVAL